MGDPRTHLVSAVVAGANEELALPGEEEPRDFVRRPCFRLSWPASLLPPCCVLRDLAFNSRSRLVVVGGGDLRAQAEESGAGKARAEESRAGEGSSWFSWMRGWERMNENGVHAGLIRFFARSHPQSAGRRYSCQESEFSACACWWGARWKHPNGISSISRTWIIRTKFVFLDDRAIRFFCPGLARPAPSTVVKMLVRMKIFYLKLSRTVLSPPYVLNA